MIEQILTKKYNKTKQKQNNKTDQNKRENDCC